MNEAVNYLNEISAFSKSDWEKLNELFEELGVDIGNMKAMPWLSTHIIPLSCALSINIQAGCPLVGV